MARPFSFDLTESHWKILRAIERLLRTGVPPSVGEIAASLCLAGETSLTPTLRIMRRNGYVEIHGGGSGGNGHALADLHHAAGRGEEAMTHLKRAVAIFSEVGGDEAARLPEVWKLVSW